MSIDSSCATEVLCYQGFLPHQNPIVLLTEKAMPLQGPDAGLFEATDVAFLSISTTVHPRISTTANLLAKDAVGFASGIEAL